MDNHVCSSKSLQHVLGITALADNFGDGRKAAYERKGLLSQGDPRVNLVYILQGGLWCKGYNPEGFTGTFGPTYEFLERTYRAALDVIGTNEIPSHFSYSDYAGDLDALNIAKILDNDITMNIFDAFYNYYESGGVLTRIQDFFENKFGSNVSKS